MSAKYPFMKILFAVFFVAHGLIHLMGTAKALGVAEIPRLTQQIDRPWAYFGSWLQHCSS